MKDKSGFTLIELLVVIAVISILMAILMPALGKARQSALSIRCQGNLKQYGIANRMYIDSNDGDFPEANNWLKFQNTGSKSYMVKGEEPDGVLWPYLQSLDIHLCSAFSQVVKGTDYADTAVSYVMNSYVGNGGSIWANWLGTGVTGVKKELDVYNTQKVIVFTEENPWTITDYSSYPFNDTHFTVGNSSRHIDNYATFHKSSDPDQGGANAVFVDGHVELLPRSDDFDAGFRLAWPKQKIPYSL